MTKQPAVVTVGPALAYPDWAGPCRLATSRQTNTTATKEEGSGALTWKEPDRNGRIKKKIIGPALDYPG
jgi:hypothetical protein